MGSTGHGGTVDDLERN